MTYEYHWMRRDSRGDYINAVKYYLIQQDSDKEIPKRLHLCNDWAAVKENGKATARARVLEDKLAKLVNLLNTGKIDFETAKELLVAGEKVSEQKMSS